MGGVCRLLAGRGSQKKRRKRTVRVRYLAIQGRGGTGEPWGGRYRGTLGWAAVAGRWRYRYLGAHLAGRFRAVFFFPAFRFAAHRGGWWVQAAWGPRSANRRLTVRIRRAGLREAPGRWGHADDDDEKSPCLGGRLFFFLASLALRRGGRLGRDERGACFSRRWDKGFFVLSRLVT